MHVKTRRGIWNIVAGAADIHMNENEASIQEGVHWLRRRTDIFTQTNAARRKELAGIGDAVQG